MTPSVEIGHIGGGQVLSPLGQPCHSNCVVYSLFALRCLCCPSVFFFSCFTRRKTFKFDLADQLNWTLFKTMTSVRYHFTPTAATYKAVGLESGRSKVNSNFIQCFPLSVLFDFNVKLMRRAVRCPASRDVRGCFHKIIG